MLLRPPFPQQGHHMHFYKPTLKSFTSGLCSAPKMRRRKPSAAELPALALQWSSLAPPALEPTDTSPSAPQGWAQGQASGHFSRPPASHLDIPIPSALPPSWAFLCSAPWSCYSSHLPKSIFLLGWEISCSQFMQCLVHERPAGTITEPDVV